jgi:hypothetical protein
LRDHRRSSLIFAFASMGITSSAIPASLPTISTRIGTDPVNLLPGISVLFGGLFVGVLVTSAAHRVAPHILFAIGAGMQFAGMVILAAAADPTNFFVACAIAGCGFGFAEPSGSVLARRLATENTPAFLTGLTGTVALSASICPIVIGIPTPIALLPAELVALACVHLVSGLLVIRAWRGAGTRFTVEELPRPVTGNLLVGVLAVAGALFLFVGVETMFSGWSSVLPLELLGLNQRTAAFGTSAFWVLMAIGRLAALALLRGRLRPRPYLIVALLAGAVTLTFAASLAATSPVSALILAGLATVFLAPGYSLIIGIALAHVNDRAARRLTGLLVAIGSAGGSAIPLVAAGLAGANPSRLFALAAVLLLACVALAISQRAIALTRRRLTRR